VSDVNTESHVEVIDLSLRDESALSASLTGEISVNLTPIDGINLKAYMVESPIVEAPIRGEIKAQNFLFERTVYLNTGEGE